jgi:hypothetical protein
MKRFAVSVAVAVLGAASVPVTSLAGPVTVQSAQVVMTYQAVDGSELSRRTFDLDLPGAATVEFNGVDNGGPGVGDSSVEYNFPDTNDEALFHARVFASHDGPPATSGSRTEVTLTFTTDRALRYRLASDPNIGDGSEFGVSLGDFSARGEVLVSGRPVTPSGWPIWFGDARGVFDFNLLVRDGVLEPGAHTLSILARSGLSQSSEFEPDGGPPLGSSVFATFDLELTPQGDPAVIPLPAAASPGLALLGGIAGAKAARRRLRAR